jgi:hypothetical protein
MKNKIIILKKLDKVSYDSYDSFSMGKHLVTYEVVGGQIVYKKYHEDASGRISSKVTKGIKSCHQANGPEGGCRFKQMLFSDIVPNQKIKGARRS